MLKEKKKYSLRKYKVGLFSVLVGTGIAFAVTDTNVQAAELEGKESTIVTAETNKTETTAPTVVVENNTETPSTTTVENDTQTSTPKEEVNKIQAGTPSVNSTTTTKVIPPHTDPNTVSEENNLINLQPLWDNGIKGQGRVIAVLDTGLDISHNIFQLLDKTNARYKNKEELEAVKKKAGINYGKWYNDKVIFAYNYSDMNDEIKELDNTTSHGTHVSGSAVGNATKPAPSGDIIKGVAPEAQLIFMRLFSDKKGFTEQNFIMARAIEDAIKLGADTINMSFGSANGVIEDLDDDTRLILEKAKKAGVSVLVAAGNYATSGYWHAKPKAENPDYSTINTPAVDPNVLAIAAYNASVDHKTSATIDSPNLKGNTTLNNGHSDIIRYNLPFRLKGEQDYVYLPKSTNKEDYNNSAVNGKVALIESSTTDPNDPKDDTIIGEIRKAGAKAVVIFKNDSQADKDTPSKIRLGGYESTHIPVGIIGNNLGKELAAHSGDYKINLTDIITKVPYEDANKMLYFSGWGVSGEGELKPDVSFPGGMIYSSVNDDSYYMNSGTSMATPHAAGAIALIKQVLEQRFPNYSKEDLESLVQNLLMSTAKPAINPESNTYYSPRKQGAGLADVTNAAYGDLYLTTKDKKPSISLGNIDDKFEFEVTVHNLSNKDRELNYNTSILVDEVKDGRVTLNARKLANVSGETIVVPANGSKTVKVKVDTSTYTPELSKLMKNGYFIEGFTFFKDSKTNKEVVSAPFLGFKGNFQDLQGIEKPIYEFTGNDKPFYYYTDEKAENKEKDSGNYFTSLISTKKDTDGNVVLGEVAPETYDASKLYFSPNGDGDFDSVKLNAVMLRDVENVHLAVYKKDDVNKANPIYEAGNENQKRSEYGFAIYSRNAIISSSDWNGKDKDGNLMPDGEYQYVITYRPSAAGAKKQELNFIVKIDNTAPTLENTSGLYNSTTRVFNPGNIIENGSGLNSTYLSYVDNGTTYEIQKEKDGTYIIPAEVDLSTVKYSVWDKVNNTTTIDINGNLIVETPTKPEENNNNNNNDNSNTTPDKLGKIEVTFTDSSGYDYNLYPEIARYIVLNERGERVDDELNKHFAKDKVVPTLPYGTYTIKIVDQDNKVSWLSAPEVTITIDENSPQKVVDFKFSYAEANRLDLVFNQEIPEGTRVFAVNKNGRVFEFIHGKYNKQAFEKALFNGDYTVNIVLPEGYKADRNNFVYSVTNGAHYININIAKEAKVTPPINNNHNYNNQSNNQNNNYDSNNNLPNNEQTRPLILDENNERIPHKSELQDKKEKESVQNEKVLPKTGIENNNLPTAGFAALLAGIALAVRKRKENK